MSLSIIRYYTFKDTVKYISPSIQSSLELNNQDYFKYALFLDSSSYYHPLNPFKKDPYQISSKLFKDHFEEFLLECLEQAYLHASDEEKMFCYFLLLSYTTNLFFYPYIQAHTTKKKTNDYIENMLESYFFSKNEKQSIHKINLADYFFDAFELDDADFHLIEKPIKRIFGFFCTRNYFKLCYQSNRFYYDHLARSKTGIKKIYYFFYDTLFNHRKGKKKAKYYLYHKKIDTTILNLNHESYCYKEKEYNYNVDELYIAHLKLAKEACNAINEYFNFNQNTKVILQFLKKIKKDSE